MEHPTWENTIPLPAQSILVTPSPLSLLLNFNISKGMEVNTSLQYSLDVHKLWCLVLQHFMPGSNKMKWDTMVSKSASLTLLLLCRFFLAHWSFVLYYVRLNAYMLHGMRPSLCHLRQFMFLKIICIH